MGGHRLQVLQPRLLLLVTHLLQVLPRPSLLVPHPLPGVPVLLVVSPVLALVLVLVLVLVLAQLVVGPVLALLAHALLQHPPLPGPAARWPLLPRVQPARPSLMRAPA